MLWQNVEEIQIGRSVRWFVDFHTALVSNRSMLVEVTRPKESMPQESVFKL